MAEASRQEADLSGPTWILAHRQTAGRGRRGRVWLSLAGNFTATYIWRPGGGVAARALRSFVAALALYDALLAVGVAPERLGLKWPNDVLLDGGKLAGILLESVGASLLIGFGVNLAGAPEADALDPWACPPVSLCGKTGLTVSATDFLDRLAPAFAAREQQFLVGGFTVIRRDWLGSAAHLGQPLVARLPQGEIHGTFETVDEAGLLVLNASDGEHRIPAADIFFA